MVFLTLFTLEFGPPMQFWNVLSTRSLGPSFILIHKTNPQSRPVGITIFTHVVRPSVRLYARTFQNRPKQNRSSLPAGTVGWPSGSLMTPSFCSHTFLCPRSLLNLTGKINVGVLLISDISVTLISVICLAKSHYPDTRRNKSKLHLKKIIPSGKKSHTKCNCTRMCYRKLYTWIIIYLNKYHFSVFNSLSSYKFAILVGFP